jgi:hypothetical protein
MNGRSAAPAGERRAFMRPISAHGRPRRRGRLVFGLDATASRSVNWDAALQLTDVFFSALPGELDVALAVHGGSALHTFTKFTTDAALIRHAAARIRCEAGGTCLLTMMQRVSRTNGVGVFVYVGDSFEESEADARRLAGVLRANGTRVIILHDRGASSSGLTPETHIFCDIARRSGGAVLPFDPSSIARLRELLAAVAVLAVGGPALLRAKQSTMAAAAPLLEELGERPVAEAVAVRQRHPTPLAYYPPRPR